MRPSTTAASVPADPRPAEPFRRLALWGVGAVALVLAYWLVDTWLGPFSAARRYDVSGKATWLAMMAAGEWLWYAAMCLAAGAGICAVRAWPRRSGGGGRVTTRRLVAGFVLFAIALTALLRVVVLHDAPITDDEMIYRFEARNIAAGRLTADPPPARRQFKHTFLGEYNDRWFGQYSFGHPAVLALGERLGWVGLAGVLLVGCMVLLVFLLARRLFDETTAVVAAALAATSPLVLSTGATLLSQNSATVLVLLGLLLTLRAADTGRFADTFGAALALGGAFWCRQMEPAMLGLGPLALLGWRVVRGPSRGAVLAGGLAGSVLVLAPLLVLQKHLWDNPWWTNYHAYWWGFLGVKLKSPFGFGLAPMTIHTPAKGLVYTLQNAARLDLFLCGLPGALALAVAGIRRAASRREALAVFAGVPLTFFVLFFYFWPSLADTGPQLFHAAGVVALPFVAAGLLRVTQAWGRAPLALAAALLVAVLTFWPSHLGALRRVAQAGDELPRLTRDAGLHHAVVFANQRPWPPGCGRGPINTLPVPRPDLADDVLFLNTAGKPADAAFAAQHFPTRRPYSLTFLPDCRVALLPLAEYTGHASLEAAARPRDLPES